MRSVRYLQFTSTSIRKKKIVKMCEILQIFKHFYYAHLLVF